MKSPLGMFKRLFLAFVFSEKQHPFPAAFLLVFFLFSLSLFSSNKTHVRGAARGEWKEIYLINWAVFFFSCVARGGGLVLWSNVCSSCQFICTFFHAFSWYIGLWAAVVVQRKSQRIWNRAHLRISHKLCCENSNVSSGSVQFIR